MALAQSLPSQPQFPASAPATDPRGSSTGWCYPPPTPKTQIGLVVFRKRQSCLYLSKGSADYSGPRGCLAAGRGLTEEKPHKHVFIENKLQGMTCLSSGSAHPVKPFSTVRSGLCEEPTQPGLCHWAPRLPTGEECGG